MNIETSFLLLCAGWVSSLLATFGLGYRYGKTRLFGLLQDHHERGHSSDLAIAYERGQHFWVRPPEVPE